MIDLNNIPARYIFGNLAISAAHLAGSTKRKMRIRGAKGDNSSRSVFHYRTYCPECPTKEVAHPENNVHVKISGYTKHVSCKNGHTWQVRN